MCGSQYGSHTNLPSKSTTSALWIVSAVLTGTISCTIPSWTTIAFKSSSSLNLAFLNTLTAMIITSLYFLRNAILFGVPFLNDYTMYVAHATYSLDLIFLLLLAFAT